MNLGSFDALAFDGAGLAPTDTHRDVPTALHGDWEDLATDPDPEWALWEDV